MYYVFPMAFMMITAKGATAKKVQKRMYYPLRQYALMSVAVIARGVVSVLLYTDSTNEFAVAVLFAIPFVIFAAVFVVVRLAWAMAGAVVVVRL